MTPKKKKIQALITVYILFVRSSGYKFDIIPDATASWGEDLNGAHRLCMDSVIRNLTR